LRALRVSQRTKSRSLSPPKPRGFGMTPMLERILRQGRRQSRMTSSGGIGSTSLLGVAVVHAPADPSLRKTKYQVSARPRKNPTRCSMRSYNRYIRRYIDFGDFPR